MAAKFMTLACLVAAASAIHVSPVGKLAYAAAPVAYAAAPVAYAPAPVAYAAAPIAKYAYAEPEAPAHYEFEYSVQDSHSGDVKQQKESRQGDAVQGSYSLLQPDGVQRIVEYTADKEHGFNAIVRYEGHPTAAPAKIAYAAAPVAKIAYAPAPAHYAPAPAHYAPAPVHYAPAPVHYAPAPVKVAYAAPVAKVAYTAPVAKIAYAAPVAKVAYAAPVAKIAYAPAPAHYAPAPVHYAPAPVHYAPAPVHYAAAPAAKVYTENHAHVTFSSPAISYQH